MPMTNKRRMLNLDMLDGFVAAELLRHLYPRISLMAITGRLKEGERQLRLRSTSIAFWAKACPSVICVC